MNSTAREPYPVRRSGTVRAVIIPVVIFALAGVLLADLWPFTSPIPPATATPSWATNPSTVRQPKLRPEITLAGYTYRCSDCHNLFPSPRETTRTLSQHRDIILEHGINNRCFNCHHRENRDAFADDSGNPISYDQPQLLCAKCHGPVYRDWLNGSHGRTNGYWDSRRGPVERAKCIQCHDPHVPPFASMHPAPAPHTLRMGDQEHRVPRPEEQKNPLLIFRQALPADEDSAEGEH